MYSYLSPILMGFAIIFIVKIVLSITLEEEMEGRGE